MTLSKTRPRWRLLAALIALSVAAASMSWVNPASAEHVDGTCLGSMLMPCSATGGQTYGTTTLGADGNDDETAVEAVLAHVLGGPMEVTPLARGLTTDASGLDVTPNRVAGTRVFDWSYHGSSAKLAYITVKAADAFAVFGVAGTTSGRIDVTELLGGHEISHVSVWNTDTSTVTPVRAKKLHGRGFLGNMRLSEIKGGRVGCVHVETFEVKSCRFGRNSGNWLESLSGDFAVSGQPITLDGEPGGEYVVAARINRDGSVPALEPTGRDAAGTAAGMELAGSAVIETALSPTNGTGRQLQNFATREVCARDYPHPDGARLTRVASPGVYCYTGRGAALNDPNGYERDEFNRYLLGRGWEHTLWLSGWEVFAAKRPATVSWPGPGYVRTDSSIVWRTVAPTVRIAN